MVHLPDKQVVEASHASRNSNLLQKARAEYFLVVGVKVFPKEQCLSAQLSSQTNFCPWCSKKIQFPQSAEREGRVSPRENLALNAGKTRPRRDSPQTHNNAVLSPTPASCRHYVALDLPAEDKVNLESKGMPMIPCFGVTRMSGQPVVFHL